MPRPVNSDGVDDVETLETSKSERHSSSKLFYPSLTMSYDTEGSLLAIVNNLEKALKSHSGTPQKLARDSSRRLGKRERNGPESVRSNPRKQEDEKPNLMTPSKIRDTVS